MSRRTLIDRGLRVELKIDEGGVLLEVIDSATLRFRIDPVLFGEIFGEESLQLSTLGNYCRIERIADRVHFEFGIKGEMGSQGEISVTELSDALNWARDASRLPAGHNSERP